MTLGALYQRIPFSFNGGVLRKGGLTPIPYI